MAWTPGDREILPLFGLPVCEILPGDPVNLTLFGRAADERKPSGGMVEVSLGSACADDVLCWSNRWPFAGSGDLADVSAPVWWLKFPASEAPRPTRLRLEPPDTKRLPGGHHLLAIADGRTHASIAVRGTSRPARPTAIEADFGFVALRHAGTSRSVAHPGSTISVDLWWMPTAKQRGESSPFRSLPRELIDDRPVTFIHLVGPPRRASGDPVWAGHDGPPSSGRWSDFDRVDQLVYDRHVLTIDRNAPPGTYTVEAGLYDPATGERYPVSGSSADPANRRVILGTVEVR